MKKILFACAICAMASFSGCKTDDEPEWETEIQQPTTSTEVPPAGATGIEAVRLNELNGNGEKYIELYNTSDEDVDIAGVQLRKDGETMVYVAPAATVIGAHDFLVLLSDQPDYSTGFSSGLSAKKSVMIELLAPDGRLLDLFKNPSISLGDTWGEKDPKYNGETNGEVYARNPDGTGNWYMQKSTRGASNGTSANGEEIIF
ncbi:MAG: lamin tail domain-containing protein [Prevotella sp.]